MADGIARAGWDIDLRHGEAREDAFVHVFLKDKVEHKSDEKCRKTGNLFIEFRQKGRPSGIATTEAHWWAFEYDRDCWLIIPTERLKALASRAYKDGRIARGGDYNNYEGVLVPIEWFVRPWKAVH
ncbi:MAG TPA: hypothetical protein VF171_00960 [Trueperaceae bacterium]